MTDTSYERMGLTEAPRCPDPDCNGPLTLDIEDVWHCADCGAAWPEEETSDAESWAPCQLEADEIAELEAERAEERAREYES